MSRCRTAAAQADEKPLPAWIDRATQKRHGDSAYTKLLTHAGRPAPPTSDPDSRSTLFL